MLYWKKATKLQEWSHCVLKYLEPKFKFEEKSCNIPAITVSSKVTKMSLFCSDHQDGKNKVCEIAREKNIIFFKNWNYERNIRTREGS